MKLTHKQTLGIDTLELHAEEHGGDVLEYESLMLFDGDVLFLALLVHAHEHVSLCGEMDVRRVGLVVQRHEANILKTLNDGLLVLGVVGNSTYGSLIVFEVSTVDGW